MADLIPNILTLFMLIMLQAVLGFDNLLYISIESKRVPLEKQKMVRTWGIGLAIVLRIVLLFVLMFLMDKLTHPWFSIDTHAVHGSFGFSEIITLFGGGFIIYTAIKEVLHMVTLEESHDEEEKKTSVTKAITMIVVMNAVFSFDSILGAMAITNVAWIMIVAIISSGLLMIWMADRVSEFLQKNKMYEVLGLFVLFIVGILLVSEGGHKANLSFFGHHVEAMSKATFYFVIAVLVAVDLIQGRYQKKLLAKKTKQHG
ncbi:TerC family protein [Rubritalea profundi]|uniref:Tellurium resistance protein TerC n=1 Tax=Rubritalea profundi TaxID=1658618 RepID=A0A2S7U156_9BACT|nr:TerC family protein [Rubritalea profundi]PQJ28227.1 tellurium resistance protein TerC [Rubritalea profundi]